MLEAELKEQTAGVRNIAFNGPPAVDNRPPFTTGACFESLARTEISIVTNPRNALALEIVKPEEGTVTPPICAST